MDVIVLLCDALRYDCVNSAFTPNLSQLSDGETSYRNAYAPNTCTVKSMPHLIADLPERMSEAGYRTALISTNIFVTNFFGRRFQHSDYYPRFSSSEEITDKVASLKYHVGNIFQRFPQGFKNRVLRAYSKGRSLSYASAEELLGHVRFRLDGDSFVWCHLMDPHMPYFPRNSFLPYHHVVEMNNKLISAVYHNTLLTAYETALLRRLYVENVAEMDNAIGEFAKGLDDSVLVITSDHGEEFAEQGQYTHPPDKFIEALWHVPLIVLNGESSEVEDTFMMKEEFRELMMSLAR